MNLYKNLVTQLSNGISLSFCRVNNKCSQYLLITIFDRSSGRLYTSLFCVNVLSPPLSVRFFGEGRASGQPFQVSHRRNNVVLGRIRVRVRCKNESTERDMVFCLLFASVPRTLGGHCKLMKNTEHHRIASN